MPLKYRCRAKVISDEPDKKARWNQGRDQQGYGVYANRCAAKNFGPHGRMRNQSADPRAALLASQTDDKGYFTGAFQEQSDEQDDRQREKSVEME